MTRVWPVVRSHVTSNKVPSVGELLHIVVVDRYALQVSNLVRNIGIVMRGMLLHDEA